ncbi:hypothetical protein ABIC06_004526 [Bradyrhizobium sp. RT7b]
MRSYPWRSEARRSSIHGPQRAGPQPDDTAVCTPAIGLAGRYRIGPSPVRNAFTPTNQGDAHLSSHRQLASRAAPVGAYKNREHRYLGIEVDDALAIAEQVDVWLPWQSRPALPPVTGGCGPETEVALRHSITSSPVDSRRTNCEHHSPSLVQSMPRTKKMAPASAGGHDDAGASGQALTLWDRDRHRKDKPGSIRTFPAQVLISATSYLLPESARDLSRAALGCNCPVPAGFRRRRQPKRFQR